MGGTLFGPMILIQDGVFVSQFLLGFSYQTQEVQILWRYVYSLFLSFLNFFLASFLAFNLFLFYLQFYRVQVGIQSPEGITSTRGILRRYSDFLKLLSEVSSIVECALFIFLAPMVGCLLFWNCIIM